MTASDVLGWVLSAAWGSALGGFYFYGLWWSLGRISRVRRPRRWLAVGFAVRLGIALLGFWLVIRRDPTSFFFTLGAFFLARLVLTRLIAGPGAPGDRG